MLRIQNWTDIIFKDCHSGYTDEESCFFNLYELAEMVNYLFNFSQYHFFATAKSLFWPDGMEMRYTFSAHILSGAFSPRIIL